MCFAMYLFSVYFILQNLSPDKIFHIIVAPCYDKKLEALRIDFSARLYNSQDVDCVLTSGKHLHWNVFLMWKIEVWLSHWTFHQNLRTKSNHQIEVFFDYLLDSQYKWWWKFLFYTQFCPSHADTVKTQIQNTNTALSDTSHLVPKYGGEERVSLILKFSFLKIH